MLKECRSDLNKTMSSSCIEKYEKAFNNKIDALKDHCKYNWLRKYSEEVLRYHTGAGYLQIKAADFMDRIISMPVTYIRNWLDSKNDLSWTDEFKANLTEFKKFL